MTEQTPIDNAPENYGNCMYCDKLRELREGQCEECYYEEQEHEKYLEQEETKKQYNRLYDELYR